MLRTEEPRRSFFCRSIKIGTLLLVATVACWWSGERAYEKWMTEQYAFRRLGVVARQMIAVRAQGVSADGRYVTSFADFLHYSEHHIDTGIATPDNPFPNILPGGKYLGREMPATSYQDVLLDGRQFYHRPWGTVHVVLRCDGSVQSIP